jgi:hypothetical protein
MKPAQAGISGKNGYVRKHTLLVLALSELPMRVFVQGWTYGHRR